MGSEPASLTGGTPRAPTRPPASVSTEDVRSEVGYIPAIEGLRGIAVLWVVLFHYVVIRSGQFAHPFVPLLNRELWRASRGYVLGNLGLHVLFLHYTTTYSAASLLINGALWTGFAGPGQVAGDWCRSAAAEVRPSAGA